jgi:hypothetical protein
MKLYDLVEGYYDPPEYPDTHDGFVNSELDDVTELFNLVGYDPYRVRKGREPGYGCAIVEHKETKEKYVLHEDDIEEDYFVDDFEERSDQDEDGHYSYRESQDNSRIEVESYTMYSTICYMESRIANTFEEYTEGEKILKLTPKVYGQLQNDDVDFYRSVIKIFTNKSS